MEEDPVITFTINDELCRRAGLTAKWINGHQLSVAAYNPITSTTKDRVSDFASQNEVNIFHLTTEFIFEEPILRCLIAEANGVYLAVQDLKRQGTQSDYVKISRTYRSIIRACLEKLEEEISNEEISEEDKTRFQNYITIFYSIECVWHLCEILYIDTAPSNIVVPQLLEWTRFHFPSYERIATELLLYEREANTSEDYWPTVKGLILQGQIEVARAILQLHSLSETTAFKMAEQILKTMPVYNVYGGLSIQKFRSQWHYWLTDTELKLSAGILSSEPELEEIVKLITGNQYSWNQQIKQSTCWYEFLSGYLFYTEPACKYFELGSFANLWINRWANEMGFTGSGFLKQLDRVILSVMENDMNQVLHSIQKIGDNQWFVTHLTDLLYHCGQLQVMGEQKKNIAFSLRDALLYEFGSALMSRDSLWMMGVDYLEQCSEGAAAMELLLTKVPVENERQALKVIEVAKQRGLSSVEREICRVQATRSMANERYGNALEWAIRSKDAGAVTAITDFFLTNYSKTGEMLCPDVLGNIGGKMFISPRLVFLVKYFDFHQFYKRREFIEAAKLLVNLLNSKITPEYFWPSLLIDSIPLLESKDPKMPSKETFVILQHLEMELTPLIERSKKQMEKAGDKQPHILKDYRMENIDEIVKLIRLACARNLARAIVIENTFIS